MYSIPHATAPPNRSMEGGATVDTDVQLRRTYVDELRRSILRGVDDRPFVQPEAARREQVDALESKLREVLEQSQEQKHQLANRIADLVQQHADIHTRVLELEPVAAEVPMLQAAVEDSKAELTEREQILFQRERQLADINEDIETIASRPVAGPVFRLLTKGKLRI